ncbi:MAG: dTDP-4-dehydrorhamnose reductase, partial [Bacteroidales bacterium]
NTYFFTDVTELDITNRDSVKTFVSDNQIKVIVNCAAYTAVDKAEDDQQLCDLINHLAAKNLAEVAKEFKATLIHVSTDYVFDGTKNTPYTEEDTTTPLGVYGVTKLSGERAIENSGCDYLILRTSWLYSSFGNNFAKTIQRLSSERDNLNVVFDQVGTPTYAADLAALIFQIIEKQQYTDNNGVYHFSNEGVCSWYDFAVEIANLSGNNCNIQPCHSSEFPAKVTRPNFSVLDKTKVKKTFAISIPHWKDGLVRMINQTNK